jgi:hypothetical protein
LPYPADTLRGAGGFHGWAPALLPPASLHGQAKAPPTCYRRGFVTRGYFPVVARRNLVHQPVRASRRDRHTGRRASRRAIAKYVSLSSSPRIHARPASVISSSATVITHPGRYGPG